MDRLELISPEFGSQSNTYLITKDETTYVYYLSNHSEGKLNLWRTIVKPFEENKTEKVDDQEIKQGQLETAKEAYYALLNGTLHTLNLDGNKLEKINTEATFRKNLVSEFNQMFFEAWANFESNFYDENFHGENWQELRDQYAKFLPYITKRSQLSMLFNDMLGELNTSHFGFNSSGKEDDPYYGSKTSETGIMYAEDNPYKVTRVIAKSPANITGKDIKPGDVLTHVNGQQIDTSVNREFYFSEPSMDEEMQLTFNRNGKEIMVDIHPIASGVLRGLLYDEWVAHNQAYVDKKSANKIAYVHMNQDTEIGSGQWLYGMDSCSEERAIKAAGHELKGLEGVFSLRDNHLRVPLMNLIGSLLAPYSNKANISTQIFQITEATDLQLYHCCQSEGTIPLCMALGMEEEPFWMEADIGLLQTGSSDFPRNSIFKAILFLEPSGNLPFRLSIQGLMLRSTNPKYRMILFTIV